VRGETLRVEASSRGWRRFYVGFITFIVAYAVVVFAVEDIMWLTRAIPVVLLIGQLPLAVGKFAYTEVTQEGLDLDVRVRRRHIPWAQVQEIELGGPYGRPPRVQLTDGTEVKSLAFGGFMAGPEADPELLDRLKQAAEAHGFTLKVR
jgi:hypothetical protein